MELILRPGRARAAIPIHETPTSCAGAAASYVLRRVAYRAGAYAPGIDDALFSELHETYHGRRIDDVERWFADRSRELDDLGYRLHAQRGAWSMSDIARWVERGFGHRGAVLATSYARLHPHRSSAEAGDVIAHAVGLASEGCEAGGDGKLVTIDPWSPTGTMRGRIHPALEAAHRDRDCAALLVYWRSWA
jgi:hypothetical protein